MYPTHFLKAIIISIVIINAISSGIGIIIIIISYINRPRIGSNLKNINVKTIFGGGSFDLIYKYFSNILLCSQDP